MGSIPARPAWLKPRLVLTGLLLAVAAATGCGGGPKSGVSSASGASLVTANALAFVSVDSDLGSNQWKQVDSLSQKFPGRYTALAQLRQALSKYADLDWKRDVDPALGPQVDVVVARGPTLD